MDDQKAFEIIEQRAEQRTPVSRVKDGFSRQEVANAFAHAFNMIGGVQRLALWANRNEDKFYPLFAKLMPAQSVHISGDNNVVQVVHAIAPTELDNHDT